MEEDGGRGGQDAVLGAGQDADVTDSDDDATTIGDSETATLVDEDEEEELLLGADDDQTDDQPDDQADGAAHVSAVLVRAPTSPPVALDIVSIPPSTYGAGCTCRHPIDTLLGRGVAASRRRVGQSPSPRAARIPRRNARNVCHAFKSPGNCTFAQGRQSDASKDASSARRPDFNKCSRKDFSSCSSAQPWLISRTRCCR